jgi:serine/threonine-protein kinase
MGTVYEAEHVFTRMRVAVKVIHASLTMEYPPARRRFLREAQAPASIAHPAIAQVLDAGEEPDGTLYLVMELLVGRPLASVLDEAQVLDAPLALWIGGEILGALEAAHARGIIHRDIKPENVFLGRDDQGAIAPKLLDFGIAKRATKEVTGGGVVLGSADYMSPEQWRGQPVDPRADLWALSAVLFRALAGISTRDLQRSQEEAGLRWARLLLERAPATPPQVAAAIERGLAEDPERRFASATQMRAALAALIAPWPRAPRFCWTLDAPAPTRPSAEHTMIPPRAAPPQPAAPQPPPDDRATRVAAPSPRRRAVGPRIAAIAGGAAALAVVILSLLGGGDAEPPPVPERSAQVEAPAEPALEVATPTAAAAPADPEPETVSVPAPIKTPRTARSSARAKKRRSSPPAPAAEEPWSPKRDYE